MAKRPTWIATRALYEEPGGAEIRVRLGRPEPVSEDEWRCPYRVELGPPAARTRYAHGVDAFQALLMALMGIRAALAESERRLSWQGGEPGDAGIPLLVPQYFGLEFSRRMEQLITTEVERFAAEVARGTRR
ncbi:MAG TPA: hypothetical protein VH877_28805 [Polyangia bacterium]|jgi:hypothetical protein|nr:hypothetical protein [Polyangia bacterium]